MNDPLLYIFNNLLGIYRLNALYTIAVKIPRSGHAKLINYKLVTVALLFL